MAQGNAVMRAKRTTGPTPNAELLTACKTATCSVKGCDNPPLRTIPTAGAVVRECAHHVLHGRTTKQAEIKSRGWTPPWMG